MTIDCIRAPLSRPSAFCKVAFLQVMASGFIAESTPETRTTYEIGFKERIRVNVADPNDGRCLVTNALNTAPVQYCHCIPRRVMNDENLVCVYNPPVYSEF